MTIDPRASGLHGPARNPALGRAYGFPTPAQGVAGRLGPSAGPSESPRSVVGITNAVGPTQGPNSTAPKKSPGLEKLVAGVVPGRASFTPEPIPGRLSGPQARAATPTDAASTGSAPGALAFYRRPTDKNEVATVLSLGRALDVTG